MMMIINIFKWVYVIFIHADSQWYKVYNVHICCVTKDLQYMFPVFFFKTKTASLASALKKHY